METLYVIPIECPHEDRMAVSSAWDLGAVKETIFQILSSRICLPKNLEIKYNRNTYVSWTCAGCTVGLSPNEKDCPQRKCGLGGKVGTE
jgi:hypothetical protein